MKILLVKPYNLSDHIQPSLGLGYLATALRNTNEVVIVDCIKERLKLKGLMSKVRNLKPDLVGFQCYTSDLRFIKEALGECKNISKNLITVIGGPHPSAIPQSAFAYFKKDVDFIFTGEAEAGLPLLAEKLENSSSFDSSGIPGLVYRKNGEIKLNPQIFIEDLDALGMPAWDLIHPESYPESQHGAFFKKFPIAPIIITRGCPFRCTFCAGKITSGNILRKHSIAFTINQIAHLYNKHKIREFHIIDDNFTLDKNYAKELLRQIADLKLDLSLATPNGIRIDLLDRELLGLMKKSGLYLISLGIESGSDRVLALMKKEITARQVEESINMIHEFGIEIAGFFMLGFPEETIEEMKKTIRFSLELGLIRANYFTYLPFPGTLGYEELKKNRRLESVDWDKFYFMSVAYAPEGLSRRKLKSLQRYAFFRFYFRPQIIFKNILAIKSLRHLKFLLRRFFHWIIMS